MVEEIKLACLAIRGLVADSREPKVTKHLNVEPHAMEAILGKDGRHLKRLQHSFRVHVKVQFFARESKDGRHLKRLQHSFRVHVKIDDEPGDSLRKISINGTEESVALAEARIIQLMSRGFSSFPNPIGEEEISLEEVNNYSSAD
ncbi:unnamed protein product [Strongylus vulgaris]|uniref:K Homology domain-containing protein n=1 Tax=Strongylus vulgaris TaxID=40348 RepID=A0A3P7L461_STRVU|nr:unnamed protein product [Strongylus vulgaris]